MKSELPPKEIIEKIIKDFLEISLKLNIKAISIAKMIIDTISPKDHNKLKAILIATIF